MSWFASQAWRSGPSLTRRAAAGALSVALFIPTSSFAQDGGGTSAAPAAEPVVAAADVAASTDRATQIARDLFDRGKSEYLAGKFESAASLFAASEEQLPRPNTLLLLADCYESLGRLKSAHDTFERAEERARETHEDTLALTARTRVVALVPRIPRLEIQVTPAVATLSVTLDGVVLAGAELERPLPLDAGRYQLEAHAPGYEDATVLVQLVNDNSQLAGPQMVAIRLTALPLAAAPAPVFEPEPATQAEFGNRQLVEVVGGVGILSLLTATALSTAALVYYNDAKCSANRCRQAGYEARHTAIHLANVASVFGVSGVTLLAAGSALYFFGAPEPSERALPRGLGVGWTGAF
jgi:hypothetical protein